MVFYCYVNFFWWNVVILRKHSVGGWFSEILGKYSIAGWFSVKFCVSILSGVGFLKVDGRFSSLCSVEFSQFVGIQ